MRRREFISMLGGALAAPATLWPQGVRAQQPARVPRIGWIAIGTPQGSEFFDAVREGLRQLDYAKRRGSWTGIGQAIIAAIAFVRHGRTLTVQVCTGFRLLRHDFLLL